MIFYDDGSVKTFVLHSAKDIEGIKYTWNIKGSPLFYEIEQATVWMQVSYKNLHQISNPKTNEVKQKQTPYPTRYQLSPNDDYCIIFYSDETAKTITLHEACNGMGEQLCYIWSGQNEIRFKRKEEAFHWITVGGWRCFKKDIWLKASEIVK